MENLAVGTSVKVNGSPFHSKAGIVVDADAELFKARKVARETGQKLSDGPIRRAGLVPVFVPEYPTTLWWWFAPHQLQPLT